MAALDAERYLEALAHGHPESDVAGSGMEKTSKVKAKASA